MLNRLTVTNFTLFPKAAFEFSPQLNVVVGDNGTGKSHFLRLGYVLAACSYSAGNNPSSTKDDLQRMLAEKLVRTMRPDTLGRLVSRQQGRNRSDMSVEFTEMDAGMSFSFASSGRNEVKLDRVPRTSIKSGPIFFSTGDVLSMFPGFAQAYRNRELEFDETYYDLVLALESRPLRGPRAAGVSSIIATLEQVMEGRVTAENGRFYLALQGWPKGISRHHLLLRAFASWPCLRIF